MRRSSSSRRCLPGRSTRSFRAESLPARSKKPEAFRQSCLRRRNQGSERFVHHSNATVRAGVRNAMAQAQQKQQPDRRKVERIALRLTATMRDGTRSRVKVRVIDMSTRGCRIECSSNLSEDSWIWLSIAGLETQFCRVVWTCQEFVGLEFEKPLSEAVFEKLLSDQGQLPEGAINDLRSIAILADLSRKCAVDAVVEGLRRGDGSKDRSAKR